MQAALSSLLHFFGARLVVALLSLEATDRDVREALEASAAVSLPSVAITGSNASDVRKTLGLRRGRTAVLVRDCGQLLDVAADDDEDDDGGGVLLRTGTLWILDGSTTCSSLPTLRLDTLLIEMSRSSKVVEFREIYQVKGGPLRKNAFGTWTPGGVGLEVPTPHLWERRADLGNVTLIGQAIPFSYVTVFENGSLANLSGLGPEIVRAMVRGLNVTMEYATPPDGKFGSKIDGTSSRWSGIVGELSLDEEGRGDLSVSFLEVTPERSQAIDFTLAAMRQVRTLTIHAPAARSGLSTDVTAYLSVFHWSAWGCIPVVLALLAAAAVLAIGSHQVGCSQTLVKPWQEWHRSLSVFLGYFTGSVDDDRVLTLATSVRILLLSRHGFCLLLFIHYSSDLTARMTALSPVRIVTSLEEAVQVGYRIMVVSGSSSENWLAGSPQGSPAREVYLRMVEERNELLLRSFGELRKRLVSDSAAACFGSHLPFLGNDLGLVSLTGLREASPMQMAFGLRRGSELTPLLNHQLLKLHQSGLVEEIVRKWTTLKKPKDWSGRIFVEDAVVLGFRNLFFPCLVLAMGVPLAVVLSCRERFSQVEECTEESWQ